MWYIICTIVALAIGFQLGLLYATHMVGKILNNQPYVEHTRLYKLHDEAYKAAQVAAKQDDWAEFARLRVRMAHFSEQMEAVQCYQL